MNIDNERKGDAMSNDGLIQQIALESEDKYLSSGDALKLTWIAEYAIRRYIEECGKNAIAWLRFWAGQMASPDGGIEADEGYEVCRQGDIGADGSAAFPVFLSQGATVSRAQFDVIAERRRQIEAEGWSHEYDNSYFHGELARAAAAYALQGSSEGRVIGDDLTPSIISRIWPWSQKWWKPTTPRRNLVKAGALILAEIERLDRFEARIKP